MLRDRARCGTRCGTRCATRCLCGAWGCPDCEVTDESGGRNSAVEMDRSKMSDSDDRSNCGGFFESLGLENSAFDDGGADETLVGGEASVPSARMNAEWTRFISLDLWLPLIKTLMGDDKLEFLKGLESKKCQQTPVRSRTRVVE